MGAFYSRQPNGLICRFSTICDCPSDWNMTDEDFKRWFVEQAKESAEIRAEQILKGELRPFEDVITYFGSGNMSDDDFQDFLQDVGYEGEE